MPENRIELYNSLEEKITRTNSLCEVIANIDPDNCNIEDIKEVMLIACEYLFNANEILSDLWFEEVKEKCQDTQTTQS